MNSTPGAEFVNFNGLRVEKSEIATLVQFLVQSDPMSVPTGEELDLSCRELVASIFRGCFQGEGDASMFFTSRRGDEQALRYLTGLMASRY
jgi:hypothetical protein